MMGSPSRVLVLFIYLQRHFLKKLFDILIQISAIRRIFYFFHVCNHKLLKVDMIKKKAIGV